MNYTKAFAIAQDIPFIPGSSDFDLVADCHSLVSDLKGNPENWFAEIHQGKRYRFTDAEMDSIWGVIEYQKKKIQTATKGSDQWTWKTDPRR